MKITPAAAYVSLYLYERMQQMLRLMCVKKNKNKTTKKKKQVHGNDQSQLPGNSICPSLGLNI